MAQFVHAGRFAPDMQSLSWLITRSYLITLKGALV
jgi:hypothetical protein